MGYIYKTFQFFFTILSFLFLPMEGVQWSPITTLGNDVSTEANVAVNGANQAVAVWTYSDGANSRIQSVRLAENGIWETISGYLSPAGLDATAPSVSINEAGNAVAVWQIGTADAPGIPSVVQASILMNGSTVWSAPINLTGLIPGTVEQILLAPEVAVDQQGRAIALWADSEPSGSDIFAHIRSARLTFSSNTWELLNTDLNQQFEISCLCEIQLAVAPSGYTVIVWEQETPEDTISSAILPANGTVFIQTPNLSAPGIDSIEAELAINDNGNAIVVWITDNGGNNIVKGALLPFGATVWIPTSDLTPIGNVTFPQVGIDSFGNAVSIWIYTDGLGNQRIQASSLYASQTIWSTPIDISVPSLSTTTPQLRVDPQGNAVAIWARNNILQYAALPFGGIWSVPVDLTTNAISINLADIAIAPNGFNVIVYDGVATGNLNIVQGLFTILQAPPPPSYFTGKIVKNEFLTSTQYIKQLTWGPSPDLSVVGYYLRRNGVLIAFIGKNEPLIYKDMTRPRKKKDVYVVTAFRGNGLESAGLTVTLP